MSKQKKPIWQYPWLYRESFLLVAGIGISTLAADLINSAKIGFPVFPLNIILLAILILMIFAVHLLNKRFKQLKFFSSIPAAVAAISLFMLMTIIMALTPEEVLMKIGLPSIRNSLTYYFSFFYLLLTLGATTLKRFRFKTLNDWGFLLNHLGLWLFLAASGFGAGDTKTGFMTLTPNTPEWRTQLESGKIEDLDFAIKLLDFKIEYHEPKFLLFDTKTEKIYKDKGKSVIINLEYGKKFRWNNNEITMVKINNSELFTSERYLVNQIVSFIKVKTPEGKIISGPVTSGNDFMPPLFLKISDQLSIGTPKPEPSKFTSKVRIYTMKGKIADKTIEVNKPCSINGWRVYQNNWRYDYMNMQYISILQVVRDPWMPFVYLACALLTAGALIMIFSTKIFRNK
jgi:hypothetical protein